MIQRIQSVYLFITALLSVIFFSGTLLSFSDSSNNVYSLKIGVLQKTGSTGVIENVGIIFIPAVILVMIFVVSVITIFLFRNRKIQLKLAACLICISALLILSLIWYAYSVSSEFNAELMYRVNLLLPFLMLIFSCFAYRGIRKDDKLIRSYERLR
jgi:hypothetical protein